MIATVALLCVAALCAVELLVRRQQTVRVLLLGAGPFAALAATEIEDRPHLNHKILGVVEEESAELPPQLSKYPRLGTPEQLADIVEAMKPHLILVALADRRGRLPAVDLLKHQLRGVQVEEAAERYEHLCGKLAIERLHAGSQLFKSHFRWSQVQDAMARFVSLSVGAIGLVLFAPLMVLIAIAIKATSKGPVLFCQKRIGLGGKPFELLKFRTMREEPQASEWVADNKNRITPVGAFLRRARLDELPQFVNLLRGDMNLVGPRPHPMSNYDLFNEQIPYYSLRCQVRPGLTGWAQIKYRYANNLEEETEKMRYDLYYIKHRSVWMDLQIIPATLRAVLIGKGADGALENAKSPKLVPVPMTIQLPARATAVAVRAAVPACKAAIALPIRATNTLLDWIPASAVKRASTIPASVKRIPASIKRAVSRKLAPQR